MIDLEIFNGKPENLNERLDKEKRVYELFDSLNIEYIRADHEPADTMEACLEAEKAIGAHMCKNLFLCNEQKTKFYLLIMPGDKKFRTKDLSKQIQSSRLSFAGPEYMEKYLDITPGSVSITGLMNDHDGMVRFLADKDVLAEEYIGIHPSINTSSLKISIADLYRYAEAVNHPVTVVEL